MAGRFTNTKYTKTVDSLVQATKGVLNNPYYVFTDKKPTKVTYYRQNKTKTTLDPASGLNYSHVGEQSPIKFDKILEQFSDKEILRKKLINAHTEILFTDFLATNLLVASIPWLGNALTKFRTKRSGYSGTYRIADEEFTKKAAEKHDRTKKLRQAATLALAILPAATVPFVLRKSMLKGFETGNKFFKFFSKHAAAFDYKNSIFMSRATALIMWITSDYFPYQLACRDKYEYRDTVIRGSSIGLVFWGGDLVLKKAFSKLSDKIFKTNLMNKKEKRPYRLSELKNAKYQDELKSLPKNVLKRTQKAAASLYVLNLLTVMTVLGFALPAGLNKLLRTKVDEDKMKMPLSPT